MELPECPVCLQPFDSESTIPRVLPCGHSVCDVCLSQLPQPFPHTIRCPACTLLVIIPHPQGPTGLPKNYDLLRLSTLLQDPKLNNSDFPPKPRKPNNRRSFLENETVQFIPNLWSQEFYSNWKGWVVPEDAVLVESGVGEGFFSVLYGKIATSSVDSLNRSFLKENQKVSLVRIGSNNVFDNDPRFNYSYIAKIMQILHRMRESERAELGLILRASCSGSLRPCKVNGFWCNSSDGCVYMVCERFKAGFVENLGKLNDGFVGGHENNCFPNKLNFAMIATEMCEALSVLQSEGLITGCLPLSCLRLDEFGHLRLDLNGILISGREICKIIAQAAKSIQRVDDGEFKVAIIKKLLEINAFISPELFFELLRREGIEFGSTRTMVLAGQGSNVWSLASLLLLLFIGTPFVVEISKYLLVLIPKASVNPGSDLMAFYTGWKENVHILWKTKLGTEFGSLEEVLFKCLHFDPECRPPIIDVWKCMRDLIIDPKFNILAGLEQDVVLEKMGHCLILGELCQIPQVIKNQLEGLEIVDNMRGEDNNGGAEVDNESYVKSLSGGNVKCIELKGHLDCITGLAVGGGFLFSSSFDKTVHVWSLKDFTHVHTFRGHEHKVMAVVFLNEEQPLCISGDSGGSVFIWGVSIPFDQEPIMKWREEKDWRYSGIHALAASGSQYLYTGSGDKTIKAWSLTDYTLLCTLNGHKSVVSALAVLDGVLYSGSWDGTIRLWCLSDHSPLTVLGEGVPGSMTSVLALAVDQQVLVVAHENGSIKIWRNDVLVKSMEPHKGSIFSVSMEGGWLFTGGWDKVVNVQELSGNDFGTAVPIGSIPCDTVITALLYWQGKLFVGQADRLIKVYCWGS